MKGKYQRIIEFLKDYQLKTNVKGYVIGISGGKDSTIVAKLLVDAIGSDKVLGILMPNGKQSDLSDSIEVCRLLNIDYQIVNIKQSYDAIVNQIEDCVSGLFPGDYVQKAVTEVNNDTYYVTKQAKTNIAPRLRMTTLYAIAQSLGYRVAGTGNYSEHYIGWCTKWGDMACDINPIAHLTCTDVVALGDYLKLPEHLVHKIPADGLTDKSDEDNFVFTYSELDRFLTKGESNVDVSIASKIIKMHDRSTHKDNVINIENYGLRKLE